MARGGIPREDVLSQAVIFLSSEPPTAANHDDLL